MALTAAITEKEARRQRAQLRRELARDLKKKDREKLKALRENIRRAKAHKTARLKQIVRQCQRARAANRERAKIIRAEARLEANRKIDAEIKKARSACELAKRKAKKKGADSLSRARAALSAEREFQRIARLHEKPPQLGRRKGPTAAERRAESDDQVERNIPEELVVVWRKVKKKIKATPRRTRTEAFLEWVQENSGDVYRITDEAIERDVEELVRQEAELAREMKREGRYERMPMGELKARHKAQFASGPVPF